MTKDNREGIFPTLKASLEQAVAMEKGPSYIGVCPKCGYDLIGVMRIHRGTFYDCSNPHCGYWEEEINYGGETSRTED